MLISTYLEAIEISVFDAKDAVEAGDADTAFFHARDAAHYANELLRELARPRARRLRNVSAASRRAALATR